MKKRPNISRPLFLLSLINVIGFLYLSFQSINLYEGAKTLTTGILFMSLMMMCYCLIRMLKMGDGYIFITVTALLSIGILMLTRIDTDLGKKQMLWFFISLASFFLSFFLYRLIKWRDKLFILYGGVSVALFVLTLLIGRNINGAKNWIYIGNQGFQPSEIIKILFVLSLACLLNKPLKKGFFGSETKKSIFIMGFVYVNLLFLVLQREWGFAVLFFLTYIAMFFVFGKNFKLILLNFLFAFGGLVIGYRFLSHIRTRVEIWQNPFYDATGKGYQIVQSLISISSGGFTGSGFTKGSVEYVPFVESDFIFSAICEEFGVLGGIAVILLFFILIYRAFKIGILTNDAFDKKVAIGLGSMLAFQTFIILGGVIKFIPLTGITLPFISYGGSSLLTSFMLLGILQAISVGEEESYE